MTFVIGILFNFAHTSVLTSRVSTMHSVGRCWISQMVARKVPIYFRTLGDDSSEVWQQKTDAGPQAR